MKPIHIVSTAKSPTINFDNTTGNLEISGRSILENTLVFYEPLLQWVKTYVENPNNSTKVIMAFEYYNTSTQLWLYHIMKEIIKINNNPVNQLELIWYYIDDDLKESGYDFQNFLKIPITLKHISEKNEAI